MNLDKIKEEKLFNILNPTKSNKEFKITIRFQKHLSKNYEKAVEIGTMNNDPNLQVYKKNLKRVNSK